MYNFTVLICNPYDSCVNAILSLAVNLWQLLSYRDLTDVFLYKYTSCGTRYLSHWCSLHGTVLLSRR